MSRPGALQSYIEFQRAVKTEDGSGGYTKSNVSLGKAWAEIDINTTKINHVSFIIRNRNDLNLTKDDSILWQNTNYNILMVPPVNRREMYLEIQAVEADEA